MIIQKDEQILKLCREIVEKEEYIALDTEFCRRNTYYPQASLIQIASKNRLFIIDVAAKYYSPCKKEALNLILGEDSKIIKVLHSCKQDIEVMKYCLQLNLNFKRIFDTQIAADFDGAGSDLSYLKLVKHYLHKSIPEEQKKLQKSDWLLRPLSDVQIQYAVNDVKYLYQIYPIIKQSLIDKKRLHWMQEELEVTLISNYGVKEKYYSYLRYFVQLIGNAKLFQEESFDQFDRNSRIIRKIVNFIRIINKREQIARKINLAKTRVCSNNDILKILMSSDLLYKKNKFNILLNIDEILSAEITQKDFIQAQYIMRMCIFFIKLKNNKKYQDVQKYINNISGQLGVSEQMLFHRLDFFFLMNGWRSKIDHGWRRNLLWRKIMEVMSDERIDLL